MKRIVVGITGASGIPYTIKFLESIQSKIETHCIISESGKKTFALEAEKNYKSLLSYVDYLYENENMEAPIASGSFLFDAMIILPCTMKTLASVACCYSDNLISRTADVALKERRKLLLCIRETPLHHGHLTNLQTASSNGAIIYPLMPSFYLKPKSIDELILSTISRILDLLGIENNLSPRWPNTRNDLQIDTVSNLITV